MAAQMSSFRALNELFMEQLAELETDGGARSQSLTVVSYFIPEAPLVSSSEACLYCALELVK